MSGSYLLVVALALDVVGEGAYRCRLSLIKVEDSVEHEDRVPHGLDVFLGVDCDHMRDK